MDREEQEIYDSIFGCDIGQPEEQNEEIELVPLPEAPPQIPNPPRFPRRPRQHFRPYSGFIRRLTRREIPRFPIVLPCPGVPLPLNLPVKIYFFCKIGHFVVFK